MLLDRPLQKAFSKKRRPQQKDSKFKSIAKAVSWRVLGTFDTIVISYLITGELKMAFSIGTIEVFSKILLYYVHERVWERFTVKKDTHELERPTPVSA
ncbi:DUF2061 domain-containing protein [Pontibacter ramchanderi]|uniref:Putative membrane protein n=1 Tax=Pontibacter ramchanderi TaxID=1179743 RepID=A0A2N3V0Y6_9BACT|nr:DUF2061 domain-containing protein [Pontibacter ramchanderi]PKV75277.1 putative membrane protein [Pontibacter ramchanderi]